MRLLREVGQFSRHSAATQLGGRSPCFRTGKRPHLLICISPCVGRSTLSHSSNCVCWRHDLNYFMNILTQASVMNTLYSGLARGMIVNRPLNFVSDKKRFKFDHMTLIKRTARAPSRLSTWHHSRYHEKWRLPVVFRPCIGCCGFWCLHHGRVHDDRHSQGYVILTTC